MAADGFVPTPYDLQVMLGYDRCHFDPARLLGRLGASFDRLHGMAHAITEDDHMEAEEIEIHVLESRADDRMYRIGRRCGSLLHIDTPDIPESARQLVINLDENPDALTSTDRANVMLMTAIMEEGVDQLYADPLCEGIRIELR